MHGEGQGKEKKSVRAVCFADRSGWNFLLMERVGVFNGLLWRGRVRGRRGRKS